MSQVTLGCLEGLKVLDLTDEQGHFAGRVLADLGAEVLKVEPPGGDPARMKGPFWGGEPHPDCGVQWLARNWGKRSVVIDIESEPQKPRDLIRVADVLIESYAPGYLDRLGLGYEAARKINPELVFCSITPYGQDGPYRDVRGSDLTVIAASGNLFLTGDPDHPPVRCSLPVSHYHGGAEAAAGILMALWHRLRSGTGQHVDVSLHETMMITSMTHPAQTWVTGYKGRRSGACNRVGEVIQREIWPCKDGYVSFALRGGAARIPGLIALVQYMDEEGMAPPALKEKDWKSYNSNTATQEEIDVIADAIGAFFRTKTMQALFDAACARRLMLAPANTEREVLSSRQLAAREFFVELDPPRKTGKRMPFPARFASWPLNGVRNGAPLLGAKGGGFTTRTSFDAAVPSGTTPRSIFEGLKVVEFGAGAAAPVATRYFADQGAIVVKIESRQRPDFLRTLRDDGSGKLDSSLFFTVLNCNKLSAGLNMRDPRAAGVARRLIGWADVVIENFAPGVMEKWGLDYERLNGEFPRLIMMSTCLLGQTGPERTYPGFGGQGSALSGYNYLTGWPDREPLGPFGTITDSLSPRFGAVAVAAALLHRERTGQGSYIDLSQVEVGVYCLTEWLLAYAATSESFGRIGNRSPHAAPHGVFPSREEERWVALAVHTDADWSRLKTVMGEPEWAKQPSFDHLAGRLAQVDAIEQGVAKWTASRGADEVVAKLQRAGLDAQLVQNLEETTRDPQLAHRRHFHELEHPVIGKHVVEANGIRFSELPHRFERPAPCLASDGKHVYRDLLGMPQQEYEELAVAGVLS
jgi:crotonobetainyl-CoA:carnitine CoA-transferase CaiB-like acyl-CoA transferase